MVKPKTGELYSWRFNLKAPRPANFIKADWTITKQIGQTVVVKHNNAGTVRRLPSSWMK